MTLITILLVFIAGFVFCQWIYPILDGLVAVFLQQLEVYKGKMVEKTTESSVKITKLKQSLEEETNSDVRAIGFVIPEENEEYEYEDD